MRWRRKVQDEPEHAIALWAPGDSNPEPADQESCPEVLVRGLRVL
jgi:hypothetical protein